MAIVITKETLDNWKTLRYKGYMADLHKATGVKIRSLYIVLSTGKCTNVKLASQLAKFHSKLQKQVEKVKQELEQE